MRNASSVRRSPPKKTCWISSSYSLQLLARFGARLAEQFVHLLLADAVEAALRLPALAMAVLHEAPVGLRVGDGVAAKQADAEAAEPQQQRRDDARPLQRFDQVTRVDLRVVVVGLDRERRHDEHRVRRRQANITLPVSDAAATSPSCVGIVGGQRASSNAGTPPGVR